MNAGARYFLLITLAFSSECLRSDFDRRMGVIGPPTTETTALYHPGDFVASSSDISEKLQKLNKQQIPLSPFSPHNIFSVNQGVEGFPASDSQGRSQLLDEETNAISNDYDLELKIKALDKAKESSDKHHVLSKLTHSSSKTKYKYIFR